jgi:hypothetical protein
MPRILPPQLDEAPALSKTDRGGDEARSDVEHAVTEHPVATYLMIRVAEMCPGRLGDEIGQGSAARRSL